jgi:hypothetical protein
MIIFKNLKGGILDLKFPWENTVPTPKIISAEMKEDADIYLPLYSVFEGRSPIRVSDNNPPVKIFGLVADYDFAKKGIQFTDEEIQSNVDRCKHPPTAWHRSKSGGVHAIWLFEQPVPFISEKSWKWMSSKLQDSLGVVSVATHIDPLSFSPKQTFFCGTGWKVSNVRVSQGIIVPLWIESSKHAEAREFEGVEIPLDEVFTEIEKRWPGKVTSLSLGMRCVRFWDDSANDPTGCVILSAGAMAFSGEQRFLPWEEILPGFTAKYRVLSLAEPLEKIYYWEKKNKYATITNECTEVTANKITIENATDLKKRLIIRYKVSDRVPKGGTHSPADELMMTIRDTKLIDGLAPFPLVNKTIVDTGYNQYLNSARAQILQPATEAGSCANLKYFLNGFFFSQEAHLHFLSELKMRYKAALSGTPMPGHILFFRGPAGTGKTFLPKVIVSQIFGGDANAGKVLAKNSHFTSEIFYQPVWRIDDTSLVSGGRKARKAYNECIKQFVSNGEFEFAEKYGTEVSIKANAFLFISLNNTTDGNSMLPDLENEMGMKVCFYETTATAMSIPGDFNTREELVRKELPYFLQDLLTRTDLLEPDFVAHRWGLPAYHDAVMVEAAKSTADSGDILEVVELWRHHHFSTEAEPNVDRWSGTATELLRQLLVCELTNMLARKFGPRYFTETMVKVAEANSYGWLRRERDAKKRRVIVIDREIEEG